MNNAEQFDTAPLFSTESQREREIIWSALVDYRGTLDEELSIQACDAMIERVKNTFSWMYNG